MMMGFGGIGLLVMLLVWGALILGGVLLLKALFASGQGNLNNVTTSNNASAREIIDQRYARGEITREQYETMKQDLK